MLTLRPFQREDVEKLKKHDLLALIASSPGTGKTVVAIRALAETKGALPALVVCPSSVALNWEKEIKKWFPASYVQVITKVKGKLPPRGRNTVHVLSWGLLDARINQLKQAGYRTIVADECHAAKDPTTLRSQALRELTTRAKHVLMLSGTPIVNTKRELATINSYIGLNPLRLRRLLEDVAPDIPPKKRSYLHVDFRPQHRQIYDKADADFSEWLDGEQERLKEEGFSDYEIARALEQEALIKIGYLRRLCAEFKVPAASDWIARAVRAGEPVVVFLEHQVTLKRLRASLRKQRIRHVVIEGSTTLKQRQEAVEAFQSNRYPVFIGTRAAKEGITLTAARHLLMLERFWTSADEEQIEDRIRRIGQKHKTTIWYLNAVNSIDARLDDIVRKKRKLVQETIGSAEIDEAAHDTVVGLIRSWSKHAGSAPKASFLGLGKPLPPLPSPPLVHGIVFRTGRWTPQAAAAWCRMHGYLVEGIEQLRDRFKLITHPIETFVPKSYAAVPISKDIKVITGKRRNKVKR